MITSRDLENDLEYEDIKEDVRLECSDHGVVVQVLIPRRRSGYPIESEGLIFVEFQRSDMARNAALALNGRRFAERTVVVEYVSFQVAAN